MLGAAWAHYVGLEHPSRSATPQALLSASPDYTAAQLGSRSHPREPPDRFYAFVHPEGDRGRVFELAKGSLRALWPRRR